MPSERTPPPSYRDSLAAGRFGESFAALVEAGERQGISAEGWRTLAGVSEALCLDELLDQGEPDDDFVRAADVVRRKREG